MPRKPNYAFERRQRELSRAAKTAEREEEKAKRKKSEQPDGEPQRPASEEPK